MTNLEWGRAICYSGYREGQSPVTETYPTVSEIEQDLEILIEEGFRYIRMYDPVEYAVRVCKVIRDKKLPLKMMLGPGLINEVNNKNCAWNKTVYTEDELAERAKFNDSRIDALIDIANEYDDVIFAVSVGNENTPEWGENTVPEARLIEFAKRLKEATGKIVTFNEGTPEWRKLGELAKHLDLICIHSYPLWNWKTIDEAIIANKRDWNEIQSLYPDKPVIFSEAGWTTDTLPNAGMLNDQPNEENQVEYYKQFWEWTDKEKIMAFVFEAFDEPWKGGSHPEESEKHWGIFNVDRSPKKVMMR